MNIFKPAYYLPKILEVRELEGIYSKTVPVSVPYTRSKRNWNPAFHLWYEKIGINRVEFQSSSVVITSQIVPSSSVGRSVGENGVTWITRRRRGHFPVREGIDGRQMVECVIIRSQWRLVASEIMQNCKEIQRTNN